jgi:hypothetical protein
VGVPDAFLGIPGGVHPVAQTTLSSCKLLDMAGLAGDAGDMAVEQRAVLGGIVRCLLWQDSQETSLPGRSFATRSTPLATAGDLVPFRHMAVGALDVGGGMHVVLGLNGLPRLAPVCRKR